MQQEVTSVYRVEVRNPSGDLLGFLPFSDGQWTQSLNKSSMLDVSVPVENLAGAALQQAKWDAETETFASHFDGSKLTSPNLLYLYSDGSLLQKFNIIRRKRSGGANEPHVVNIHCEDLLTTLNDDVVESYIANAMVNVQNPRFTSIAKWVRGTGWTISTGAARLDKATGQARGSLKQDNVILHAGKQYSVTYKLTRTSGDITVKVGGTAGTTRSATGTYTETITAGTDLSWLEFAPNATGDVDVSIDDVSVTLLAETLDDILPALFAYASSVTYDSSKVSSSIKAKVIGISVENDNILSVLNRIQSSGVDGYFFVDSDGVFNWQDSVGQTIGQAVRLGHNMSGVSQEVSYDKLATGVIAKGIGEGTGALTLPTMLRVPEHYWTFNGTPNDIFGTLDLTQSGTAFFQVEDAPIHGCIRLDGNGNFTLSSNPWGVGRTLSGVFSLDSLPAANNQYTIFSLSSSSAANPYFALEVDNNATNTRLRLRFIDNSGADAPGYATLRGTTTLLTDTVYMFALVDDGNSVQVFLNGASEIADTSYSGVGTTTLNFMSIGASVRNGSTTKRFVGLLDDFRLHEDVLDSVSIALEYNAGDFTNGTLYDTDAAAAHGLKVRKLTDKTITHPDTLAKVARAYLSQYSTPLTSISIDAAEVARADLFVGELNSLGPNLMPDGDFSNGGDGWAALSISAGYSLDMSAGDLHVDMVSTTPFGGFVIYSPWFPVSYGRTYQISFRIQHSATAGVNKFTLAVNRIFANVSESSTQLSTLYSVTNLGGATSANDEVITVEVTNTGAGATKGRLSLTLTPFSGTQNEFDNIHLDDVTVKEKDSVLSETFERMTLGSTIQVVDEHIDLDESQQVVEIRRDIANPLSVNYDLQSRVLNLYDALLDSQRLTSILNSAAATRIGAGQVVIQGSFVVEDWLTGGTTTINGGNITTGTITAEHINVDSLEAITATTGELIIRSPDDPAPSSSTLDAAIRTASATDLNTGAGFIVLKDGDFRFGNPGSAHYIKWNAGTLTIRGSINAQSITSQVLGTPRIPIAGQPDVNGYEIASATSQQIVIQDPAFYTVSAASDQSDQYTPTFSFTNAKSATWVVTINYSISIPNASGTPDVHLGVSLILDGGNLGEAVDPAATLFSSTLAAGTHTFRLRLRALGTEWFSRGALIANFSWKVTTAIAANLIVV